MRPGPLPLFASVVLLSILSTGCPANCGAISGLPDAGTVLPVDAGEPDPVPSERCEVDLSRFVSTGGSGASVKVLGSEAEGIGGPNAHGKAGDYLLQNDRIRVVVQGVDRHIGANPWGGTILDADLVRDGPGRDQFGEFGLLYNFGRTVRPTLFEVLSDGSAGGPAILAATGEGADNDYLSIRNQLRNNLGTIPVADPYAPVPLRITNYFILNPGEPRVRFVTAFCNTGKKDVRLAVGDLFDPGYTVEFFNGQSCTNGFGSGGLCFGLDRASWFGYQGDGVAYGYAPWNPNAPGQPEPQNAILTISGVTGTILGAPGLQGLLDWFNPDLDERAGQLTVKPGHPRAVVRDFVVGRDLGEVASIIYETRAAVTGEKLGHLHGQVTAGGAPVANARVAVREEGEVTSVLVTDEQGRFSGTLPAGSYLVSAWADGHVPTAERALQLSAGAEEAADFTLEEPRHLTVRVREAGSGAPLPAKVTVLCTGTCPATSSALNFYTDTVRDPVPDGIQRVALVPVSGEVTLTLPRGQYGVVVSRGPEYSIFPNGWPGSGGAPVDLRTGDATVEAKLAHVIDTTGFMSADFHVHAVNSPDSAVDNQTRALSFAAEGVDVLVSTDHDYVTDFGPAVKAIGAEALLATVVGEEVSTMDFGHYNLFPLQADSTDRITGGAVDWAGGEGPTLTVRQIFEEGRKKGAKTIHFNHPRGFLGGLTHVLADTDTFATHANPTDFRMAVPEGASPEDTKILSTDFNALEVLNAGEDGFQWSEMFPKFNDWFTLLSRGLRIAGTGVSDTHTQRALVGGYWRTWVELGADTPAEFSPEALSSALNAQRAIASNGPFVRVRAVRVDKTGAETSLPAGMGETLAASDDDVKVTVDIQAPEYLDVTRVELYMHRPEDDARCPIDPNGPNVRTTRVACNGVTNTNWPADGAAAVKNLALGPAQLEPVLTEDGVTYKRWHTTVTFRLPAPEEDNWIVAFVYGSRPLFPLVFDKLKPGSTVKPALPFALTNPIYVDADGNGFDHPPFHPPGATSSLRPPPSRPAPGSRPPTPEEFLERWGPLSESR
ncbi:MAG: CehA/McbA family metallohydrolase [Myxococcaceae bacterium]|nr:CehA/McbA family metallohydrolase [Myxococcaceae bacterium]